MKLYYKTLVHGNEEYPLLGANCNVRIMHQEHPRTVEETMMGAVKDMLRQPIALWLLIVNATEPGFRYYFAATTNEHTGKNVDAMYAYTESVGKCIFGNDFAADTERKPCIGEITIPELVQIADGEFVHCGNGAILRLEKVHSASSRALKYVIGGRWFFDDIHVASMLWHRESESSLMVFMETNYTAIVNTLFQWIGEHLDDVEMWQYADVSNCITLSKYVALCKPEV